MEKSTPLRIMLITNLFPPYTRGGAERVVATIADALVEAGNSVIIVTTQRDGESIEDGRYRVYRYRPWNLFWYGDIDHQPLWRRAIWRLIDLLSYSGARKVANIMFKEHPHMVMTHNLVGMGYRIPQMLRRFRAMHVHTLHDVQLVVPSGKLWYNAHITMFHRVYAWLCRRRFGSPALVVSPSQWLLDFHTRHRIFSQTKSIVLKNPVITEFAAAKNINTSDSGARFLYVGQLEEHKGILVLIEAVKKLEIGNCPPAWTSSMRSRAGKLEIVGSGALFDHVQALTRDDGRIHLHGAVEHSKLGPYYEAADAVVVPSLVHENQPTVILEAFAHGIPVIASRVGGVPELVEDGKTGILVPPGDVDALVRAMHRIADEQGLHATMRKSIFERGPLSLTPKEYVDQLLRAIGDIRK